MSEKEQRLPLNVQLSEGESREIAETPHSILLNRAFTSMASALDNLDFKSFHSLREEYGRKLIGFWQNKRNDYVAAVTQGKISGGDYLVTGEEKLILNEAERYGRDEEHVLHMERRTKREKDEVSITVDIERGLDEFMFPPTISSVVEEDETIEYRYKVIFRSGRISTFECTTVRTDTEDNYRYVKDTRVLDAAVFGIDLPSTF